MPGTELREHAANEQSRNANEEEITDDGGSVEILKRLSAFQVVEEGLGRHSGSTKHQSSAQHVTVFHYDVHDVIVPGA